MSSFQASDIASFRKRAWGVLEDKGREFWATQSAAAKLRAAAELSEHAAWHSEWPTKEDREADLADHQRLSELLARGSRGA